MTISVDFDPPVSAGPHDPASAKPTDTTPTALQPVLCTRPEGHNHSLSWLDKARTGESLARQHPAYDLDQVFGMEGLPEEVIGLDRIALDKIRAHTAAIYYGL